MDKTAISLVWITHDQRVQDHQGLTEAAAIGLPILVVYGLAQRELNPTTFGWLKTGPFRLRFLYDSLTDLHASLQSLHVAFHYGEGDLQEAFNLLASQYEVRHLFSEQLVGEEEKEDFLTLTTAFPQAKIHHYSLDTMIHPDDLPFSLSHLPMVFTDAKRLIESKSKIRAPLPTIARQQILLSIPSNLDKLHAHLDSSIGPFLKGGEQAAHHHIDAYMYKDKHILHYKVTRNGMLTFSDSTHLSAYLAHGNLSARMLYQMIKRFEQQVQANESTYWVIYELLWRDYFHFLHQKVGKRLFLLEGIQGRKPTYSKNERYQDAWIKGNTGYPLVDANMRQLNQTGFMSNRGRQNVASFFHHYLNLDWRIGASYFESLLIDYDVASNYGNWQYLSGVGVDPREDRMFNVTLQGKNYDKDGSYLTHFLKELSTIPSHLRYTPWLLTDQEQARFQVMIGKDYPHRIVTKNLAIDQERPSFNR